jgi:hypothetical protein
MNITTLVHQAERPRTAAQRRDEAVRSGEIAMVLSRMLRGRRHAARLRAAAPASSGLPALRLVRESVPAQPGPAQAPDSRECRPAC